MYQTIGGGKTFQNEEKSGLSYFVFKNLELALLTFRAKVHFLKIILQELSLVSTAAGQQKQQQQRRRVTTRPSSHHCDAVQSKFEGQSFGMALRGFTSTS